MQIVMLPISEIKPYDNNPRKNDVGVNAVAKSMREFGVRAPILLDKDKVIVYGHTRLEAAKENGMTEYPCIIAEDMTPEKTRAYRIADNHVATHSEWDPEKLSIELEALKPFEFKDLPLIEMAPLEYFPNTVSFMTGDKDPDEVPPIPKDPPKSKRGDVWSLGQHRLMCGDSTDIENARVLMDGKKAEMVFTSPPYNLGKSAALRGNSSMRNNVYETYDDASDPLDWLRLITVSTNVGLEIARYVFFNIQFLAGNRSALPQYWSQFKDQISDVMVWDKGHAQPAAGERVLNSRFEFIFIFTSDDNPNRAIRIAPNFRGTIDNVYEGKPNRSHEFSDIHGAIFPVEFPSHFISNFVPIDGAVVDLFGGCGTTMIACEQLHRQCFMMEIDPMYCEVTVARWEKFTGKKAELIRSVD